MFEAYSIGIKLSLVNNVTSGLIALGGQFNATGKQADELQKRINSIHTNLARGSLMMKASAGIFGMLKTPLEEAKKFQQEAIRFSVLGLGDKVNTDAVKFAKGMDIMGQSASDNLKLLREATAIMGDFEHAKEAAPLLGKMKFGIESVMGDGHGASFEQMFQAALKVTELRGALVNRDTGHIDMQKFQSTLDKMTQAYVASGGTVKPTDYLAAIKTGGVSAKLMNDEMFFFGLGHFMQESGGSRTGTAAMSMFQNLAMGKVSRVVAEQLASVGVISQKDIKHGLGPLASVDPMSIKNAKHFTENPFAWVNDTLKPLLVSKGYKGEELNIKLAQMFGIRTAANLADQFVREQSIADRYIERSKKAAGINGLYDAGASGLTGKELALQAKWRDLMRELGTTVLPIAIKGVETLIGVIKPISAFMEKHPQAATVFVYSLITLGGVLAVGGIASNVMAIAGLVRLLGGSALASGAAAAATGIAAGAGRGAAAGAASAAIAGRGLLAQGAMAVGGVLLAPEVLAAIAVAGAGYLVYKGVNRYMNGSAAAPDAGAGRGHVNQINLNLDGKKLTSVVVDHMGREVSRPDAMGGGYDPQLSMPKPTGGAQGSR